MLGSVFNTFNNINTLMTGPLSSSHYPLLRSDKKLSDDCSTMCAPSLANRFSLRHIFPHVAIMQKLLNFLDEFLGHTTDLVLDYIYEHFASRQFGAQIGVHGSCVILVLLLLLL